MASQVSWQDQGQVPHPVSVDRAPRVELPRRQGSGWPPPPFLVDENIKIGAQSHLEPDSPTLHRAGMILASMASASVLVARNASDFLQSSISYDLSSPTLSLDSVYFPAMVICNMNRLRSSFVWRIFRGEDFMKNISYSHAKKLIERNIVQVLILLTLLVIHDTIFF